ncbi:MRG/MORF4L-binding protein isoform X2 [Eucyclogobius newberryi]|uniref:MRG/MORF4L-binding protein isoform X2 n=1 Tax=Eucyclogobius newberryi TaxID=166745 RepID=UPI003B590008
MGEAELTLNQAEEKPPEPGLVPAEEPVIWSHEVEVCLFHAMIGHKPVGVNRHFHMMCIRDKFSQNIGRQVSSDLIWEHLGTMYDMQALHESEILPFPNSEKSFSLPDDIVQEVREGRNEEELEELRVEPPAIAEEGSNSSVKSDRSKDRDKPTESNSKDDKKKRVTPTPGPPAAKGRAPTPPAPKGGAPPPPASKGGAPPPPASKGGAPPPPAAKGGAPTPPTAKGGAPTPPAAKGGAPTPPATKGGVPTPPATKSGAPTPSATKGGAPGSTSTKTGNTGASSGKGGSSGPTPAKRRR